MPILEDVKDLFHNVETSFWGLKEKITEEEEYQRE